LDTSTLSREEVLASVFKICESALPAD